VKLGGFFYVGISQISNHHRDDGSLKTMTAIRLIVGLGNPGREYETTRHNVGFVWVDEWAREQKMHFNIESKFHGFSARGKVGDDELWLLKPQTFMNLSGRAVAALAQFYKITPAEILVVHDELDLAPGVARLKMGGGHGGHNGLKDIIAQLGTKDFWRLRIGIGHPGDRAEVSNYVLGTARREDRDLIDEATQRSLTVAPLIIAGKLEAAMLKLHSA
jgi:PTH1 family peptidyl-tRNA hydrolase